MLPRFIPMTDIKRKDSEILETLQREQERRIELREGIIRGQKAMAEGRAKTHEEVMARTAKWT